MQIPQPIAEAMGRIAFEFKEMQPFLPMYIHLMISALFPIIAGCHGSLTRPSSAAKPSKKRAGSSHGDDDEDEFEQRMAAFSKMDAILYPFIAAVILTSLYLIIKVLQYPELLNLVLKWSFYPMGVLSITRLISDILHISHSFVFPKFYTSSSSLWYVDPKARKACEIREGPSSFRDSPLPGFLSKLPLPEKLLNLLWAYRGFPTKKLTIKFLIHRIIAVRYHVDLFGIVGTLVAISALLYENLVSKKWWITNLFGFAFSYNSILLMSPTTFTIGSILLAGLFVYDIIMVFYTPMMVGVAKALDIPGMLLFPRPADAGEDPSITRYGMLGLGDIVLPGIFIGLALRFDLYLHYLSKQRKPAITAEANTDANQDTTVKAPYIPPSKNWANQFWIGSYPLPQLVDLGAFKKTYFHASVIGYVLGMVSTLIGMQVSQHPQPALLYLVPGVLGAVWLTALRRGELKELLEYTEDVEEEETKTKTIKDSKKPEKKSLRSILSTEDREHIERRQLKFYGFEQGDSGTEADTEAAAETASGSAPTAKASGASKSNVEELDHKLRRDKDRDLFFFSISTYAPLKRTAGRKKDDDGKKELEIVQKWTSPIKEDADGEVPKKRQRTA